MSMEVPPEGTPDPVADALRMRASDADRERVAGVLRDAYADGRLTLSEHEDRIAEAYRAMTYGELAPALRDLPVPPGLLAVPTTAGIDLPTAAEPTGLIVHPGQEGAAESGGVAIFGQFERRGTWTVPARLTATAVFGEGTLDFTQAVLTSRETVVTVIALFGNVTLIVPAGLAIRNDAVAILGGISLPTDSGLTGAPVLVVKGTAMFGAIEVKR